MCRIPLLCSYFDFFFCSIHPTQLLLFPQGIKRNAVLVAGLMQSGVVVLGDNVCLFIAYFQAAGAARLCQDLLATYLLFLLTWSTLVKSSKFCCCSSMASSMLPTWRFLLLSPSSPLPLFPTHTAAPLRRCVASHTAYACCFPFFPFFIVFIVRHCINFQTFCKVFVIALRLCLLCRALVYCFSLDSGKFIYRHR